MGGGGGGAGMMFSEERGYSFSSTFGGYSGLFCFNFIGKLTYKDKKLVNTWKRNRPVIFASVWEKFSGN